MALDKIQDEFVVDFMPESEKEEKKRLKIKLEDFEKWEDGVNRIKKTWDEFQDFWDTKFGKKVKLNYEEVIGKRYNEHWIESINFCYDLEFEKIDCSIPTTHPDSLYILKPSFLGPPPGYPKPSTEQRPREIRLPRNRNQR